VTINVITNSIRNTFLDCQFRFFLEYVLRLSPITEAEYFRWGRLVHECADTVDQGLPIEPVIEKFRKEIEELSPPVSVIEETEMMCNLVPDVMDAYLLKYADDNDRYEIICTEYKFELPLPCGWTFKGKIDKIVQDLRTGNKYIWERKTAASTGDSYWTDILLDSQPQGYILATQRALGIDVVGAIYDIYKKPQYKRCGMTDEQYTERIGEAYLLERDRYFERRSIRFPQEQIDAYFWDINNVAEDIQQHLESGIWSKHHPRNRKGGCSYRSICTKPDKTEIDWTKFYRRLLKNFNPEL